MESRKRSAEESEDAGISKKSKENEELKNVVAAYGSRKGEREEMQDTHILLPKMDLESEFLFRSSLFAIFDGHAGSKAADYCKNQMGKTIKEKLLKSAPDFLTLSKSLKTKISEAYKSVDDGFLTLAKQNKPAWKDGTTATTMLILNNVIYVANIGDNHNPMIHEERMRIQKAGASVTDGRINKVIEVSRSIGDLPFKSLGIISTPDLKKLTLTKNDVFAIIACDGLWKSFSNTEAVTFAADQIEAAKKMEIQQEPNESRQVAELRVVAEKLASEAVRRKCGDNVSVIIVALDMVSETVDH